MVKTTARIVLTDCSVVVLENEPSYVKHMAVDLGEFIREITGAKVVCAETEQAQGPIIAVGTAADRFAQGQLPRADLGTEGYVLKSVRSGGRDVVIAAGSTPKGTKQAIVALMRRISTEGKIACLDGPIQVVSKPALGLRGLHLNGWAFNSPYSFRRWTEQEWKSYLDILSYQGINLFLIWPFMEIIPLPLSSEDRSYLEEVRRVVDYAQNTHGMEVWMMQAANRVAKDNCGIADPRLRPYWRPSQVDLKPSDPQDFATIMESRKALFEIVNNVDGVCTIDSDPGGWAGSSLTEFVKLLNGFRDLLDRHNLNGPKAKIINWMWSGWGLSKDWFSPKFAAETARAMKAQAREPWMLIAGTPPYLKAWRDEGVLGRTVNLPYAALEGEPSYPGVNLDLDHVREMHGHLDKFADLAGVMGNTQCPLLQLQHVWAYTAMSWDPAARNLSDRELLLDLAAQIYPDHRELLADAYQALYSADTEKIACLTARLKALKERGELGRPGLVGRRLFPRFDMIADILVKQLNMRAASQKLYQEARPGVSEEQIAMLLGNVLDTYLTWDAEHGWHDLWGYDGWPLGRFRGEVDFHAMLTVVKQICAAPAALERVLNTVRQSLLGRHEPKRVEELAIVPLRTALESAVPMAPHATNLAREARASASVVYTPAFQAPKNAIDGNLSTIYWPGYLLTDNQEWLQLDWDRPCELRKVIVYFRRHESMWKRTIHLQQETTPGNWSDIATCLPRDAYNFAVAAFEFERPVKLKAIRVFNLFDMAEIIVQ